MSEKAHGLFLGPPSYSIFFNKLKHLSLKLTRMRGGAKGRRTRRHLNSNLRVRRPFASPRKIGAAVQLLKRHFNPVAPNSTDNLTFP